MPFIYREVEGLLISDYVPAAFRLIDLATLEFYKRPPRGVDRDEHDQVKAVEALSYKLHALFLADAGMGKTTFLSHIAVALTFRRQPPVARALFGSRRPLPVFVPLKILDNSLPRPILTYIRTLPIFQGKAGFKRLVYIAAKGELLILLDGYDEIYIPKEGQSSIKDELNSFFSGILTELPGDEEDLGYLTGLYRYLPRNRIWLSSRREHYLANRLAFDIEAPAQASVVAVEILGLRSRLDLVKKIFDRYRGKSALLCDELSEDAFFGYISRKLDDEMTGLSDNPLFLTVMCYLYIKGIEAGEFTGPEGTLSLRPLVLTCTSLLVRDLDEFRVRNLPNRIRRALKEKRGLYPEKKLSFLCYFASQLASNQEFLARTAFTENTVKLVAQDFFSIEPIDDEAREILRNLDSEDLGNIVRQLILQGVFVLVDNTGKEEFLDFPHRRFREVLAAEYLDTSDRFSEFIENLGKPHYREFVLIMFRLTERRKDWILEAILSEINGSGNDRYFMELAKACLQLRPKGYNPSGVIEAWIRNIADDGNVDSIDLSLLDFMAPASEFITWADRRFAKALDQEDARGLRLFGGILYGVNKSLFLEHVYEVMRDGGNRARLAAGLCLRLDGGSFVEALTAHEARSGQFRTMLSALMEEGEVTGREQWWRLMCRSCNDHQLATLFGLSLRYRPSLAPRALGFQRRGELPAIADLRKTAEELGDGVFVIADAFSELIDSSRGHDAILSIEEGIFQDMSFLENMPMPLYGEIASQMHTDWLTEQRQVIASAFAAGKLNKADADARKARLWEVSMEKFVEMKDKEINERRLRLHKMNLGEITKFVKKEMFWSKSRWIAFLKEATQAAEEVPGEEVPGD